MRVRTDPARWARVAFGVAVVVNLLLLYWPRAVGGDGVPHVDKVAHVLTFASVAWAGRWAGIPRRWLVPVLALHAVSSELVQSFLLEDRSGDLADVVADCAGILLGALAPTRPARASWRDDDARADRTTGAVRGRGADRPPAGRDA
jgi:VanZ family protein